MRPNISASAISRILSSTSLRKAPASNTWGKGFLVVGYGPVVRVYFQDTDEDTQRRSLDYIAEVINGRVDRKYVAAKTQDPETKSHYVQVQARTKEDDAPEAKERMAEASPHAVTIAEVKKAIAIGRYEYTEAPQLAGAGYVVERAEFPRDNLVRVSYKDHPHTSYALVTGGREAYAVSTVERYATDLVQAGYSTWIEYQENDGWSVLVGAPGHFPNQDSPDEVKKALAELREAVEADDLAYMTRKGGDHSLFVYYLVPFKEKVRRLEVFWTNGRYTASGRFGGPMNDFYNLPHLIEHIGHELKD